MEKKFGKPTTGTYLSNLPTAVLRRVRARRGKAQQGETLSCVHCGWESINFGWRRNLGDQLPVLFFKTYLQPY